MTLKELGGSLVHDDFHVQHPRGFIDNTASPETNYVLVIWICKEDDNGATSLIYFNGNRCACILETKSVFETVCTVDINFPSPMECVFQARG